MADDPPYRCPECSARGHIPAFIDHVDGCSAPTGILDEPSFVEQAMAQAAARRAARG